MNRLAIFCEGQTELLFVEKLFLRLANALSLHLDLIKKEGPSTGRKDAWRRSTIIGTTPKHYVQIVDCGKDSSVVSDIRELHSSLVRQGFSVILGIRDLYPHPIAQLDAVREAMESVLPIEPPKAKVALAILEVEAWFIGEHTHFQVIDAKLTPAVVTGTLGQDPATCDLTSIAQPASALNAIYQNAGKGYSKRWNQTLNIADCLDVQKMMDDCDRLPEFRTIVESVTAFLAS